MSRLHNLDFLRSFAMMMGLAIHAHLLFILPDVATDFEIENVPQPDEWILLIIDFISNWRMPVFFMLSGFFSILVLDKKGTVYFIKDRIIRIFLTCILFAFFYDILDGTLDFTTAHLWFLYELMIFILCFSLIYKIQLFQKLISRKISPKIFFIIVLWLIVTVPLAHVLNNSLYAPALTPPLTYFDLKLGNLVYYFSYFVLGVILYYNQTIFNKLAESKILILLSFMCIFAYILKLYSSFLTFGSVEDFRSITEMQFDPTLVIVDAFLKGINSIFWSLFLIGLASKLIKSDSATLRWFVELSYPIYVIHIIPLIIVSTIFFNAGFSQATIFFLTIIIGFIICVILYYIFIKFTPLNWLLNGYHKSFLKLKIK